MYSRYIKLAVIVALLFSSAPFAFADTYYQQLTDSSDFKEFTGSGCISAGTFTVGTTTNITLGDRGLMVASIIAANSPINTRTTIEISTSACGGTVATYQSTPLGNATSTPTTDQFLDLAATGSATLSPGVTYYLNFSGVDSPIDYKARTNFSKTFFFGYLTAGGTGETLPITPGVPGYTDYGIATSSQAVYCYANFASSTGFLDSVGLSISQGFCNVGVFLFVPSAISIQQFTSLGSTFATKMPFSWFFDLRTILAGATASSTGNAASLSFTFGTTTSALKPIVVNALSTSTISKYYPDPIRNAALLLMSVSFYLAALTFIYLDISKHWHNRV